jgi:hypothetical protein
MPYVEEREFTLRFEVRCEFPEDYDGEADGYEWFKEFPPLAAEAVRTIVGAIQARGGWKVRTANRGRSTEDEVTLVLEKAL